MRKNALHSRRQIAESGWRGLVKVANCQNGRRPHNQPAVEHERHSQCILWTTCMSSVWSGYDAHNIQKYIAVSCPWCFGRQRQLTIEVSRPYRDEYVYISISISISMFIYLSIYQQNYCLALRLGNCNSVRWNHPCNYTLTMEIQLALGSARVRTLGVDSRPCAISRAKLNKY